MWSLSSQKIGFFDAQNKGSFLTTALENFFFVTSDNRSRIGKLYGEEKPFLHSLGTVGSIIIHL